MAASEQSPGTPVGGPLSSPEPRRVVLVIGGPIGPTDIPGLCARAQGLLEETGADLLVLDVGALEAPGAVAVDALARLALTARRLRRRVCLRHPSPALAQLVALMGLCEVLPRGAELRLQRGRQAEEWKEARGVQKRVDPDDPVP